MNKQRIKKWNKCISKLFYTGIGRRFNSQRKRKSTKSVVFPEQKSDGTIKARTVYNSKPTQEWLTREDSSSPTASSEGVMQMAVVDAKEERDVMSNNVPNAFIQAHVPKGKTKNGDEGIVMKITGKIS